MSSAPLSLNAAQLRTLTTQVEAFCEGEGFADPALPLRLGPTPLPVWTLHGAPAGALNDLAQGCRFEDAFLAPVFAGGLAIGYARIVVRDRQEPAVTEVAASPLGAALAEALTRRSPQRLADPCLLQLPQLQGYALWSQKAHRVMVVMAPPESRLLAAEELSAEELLAHLAEVPCLAGIVGPVRLEIILDAPRLSLDLISRVQAQLSQWLGRVGEAWNPEGIVLSAPVQVRSGSYVAAVDADGLPPGGLAELQRRLDEELADCAVPELKRLLDLLAMQRARLELRHVASGAVLRLSALEIRGLSERVRSEHLPYLDSSDIPQADVLERVFRVVDLVAQGDSLTSAALEVTRRQVGYYAHAARSLGLIDRLPSLTTAGRQLARSSPEQRLQATVVHFESSVCGEAWIRWSGAHTLLDVVPETAETFLREVVSGLSEDTRGRRAQTLMSWHKTLTRWHYARPR